MRSNIEVSVTRFCALRQPDSIYDSHRDLGRAACGCHVSFQRPIPGKREDARVAVGRSCFWRGSKSSQSSGFSEAVRELVEAGLRATFRLPRTVRTRRS
jgi:hypothetical protein